MRAGLTWTVGALTILVLASCGRETVEQTLPYYLDEELTPTWLAPGAPELRDAHRASGFSLVDQTGEIVKREDLAGRLVIAGFFFTSCDQICPTLQTNLGLLQEAFAEDERVRLVSHTVTPEIDSVDVLAAYAGANDIRAGKWHLLTGERREIVRLARESYLLDLDGRHVGDRYAHTERFTLLDGEGRIRGVYNGTLEFDVRRLIEDIRVLLAG